MTSTTSNAGGEVMIQQIHDSRECDVIVVFGGREMVLRLPNREQAVKWARMEANVYKIPTAF
jgi:hypothetical protein